MEALKTHSFLFSGSFSIPLNQLASSLNMTLNKSATGKFLLQVKTGRSFKNFLPQAFSRQCQ